MYHKKDIIKSLDIVIHNISQKLSIEEIESLKQIKEQISKSETEVDILNSMVMILKLFDILKDLF